MRKTSEGARQVTCFQPTRSDHCEASQEALIKRPLFVQPCNALEAMLADSLCPRVLKAKYFPNGSLLEAALKSGASFTWQSTMKV